MGRTTNLLRVGLVARGDNSGLGNQTREFFDHIPCEKVLLMDIRGLNGFADFHPEWYEGAKHLTIVRDFLTPDIINDWVQDLDVIFTVETPYDHQLFQVARDRGIKTFLQYNYELLDNLQFPDWPKPDVFLAPTMWHIDDMPEAIHLPVPVNRARLPFRQREGKPKVFLHIVGHRAIHDRNGTDIFLKAIPLVKSNVKFLIRSQVPLTAEYIEDPRVTVIEDEVENYWDLYDQGDVLVLPRKFGGLSLQMQEALSTGMPVIMTNIEPQKFELGPVPQWLVPAKKTGEFMAKTMIDIYECSPEALAAKIDEMASTEINNHSQSAGVLGYLLSWDYLRERYLQLLLS